MTTVVMELDRIQIQCYYLLLSFYVDLFSVKITNSLLTQLSKVSRRLPCSLLFVFVTLGYTI